MFLVTLLDRSGISEHRYKSTITQIVQSVAIVFWLCGNSIWMTAELVYHVSIPLHDPARPFWYWGALAGMNLAKYEMLVHVGQGLLLGGMVLLLCIYTALAFNSTMNRANLDQNPQDGEPSEPQEQVVFGCFTLDEYLRIFIGPWLAKDFFWTVPMLWPGMCLAVLMFFLMCDYYRRTRSRTDLAMIFWLVGNALWMYLELIDGKGSHGLLTLEQRSPIGLILFAGVVLTISSLVAIVKKPPVMTSHPFSETTRLLQPS